MPIPTSGPLTLAQIQTEFGGTNPIGINEYYAGGGLVPSGTSGINGPVPSSGAISFSIFYGTTAALPFGTVQYTSPGTYTFVVPAGYTSISAVAVGAGAYAGGGGALSYSNAIPTTPGESLTVVVGAGGIDFPTQAGGSSSISRGGTTLLRAVGGSRPTGGQASGGIGAVRYSGGNGQPGTGGGSPGGGGGAAGYAGNGGNAGTYSSGSSGNGGGGGGAADTGFTGGGGGVGLIVQGASGAGGNVALGPDGGKGGSGGGNGAGPSFPNGESAFGGAAGGAGGSTWNADSDRYTNGTAGGVRIIYGGTNKNYPNNSAP